MVRLTIQQACSLALDHHQRGELRKAEQLYRQILAQQPGNAQATHYLGVIAHQEKRYDLAVSLLKRAIQLAPDYADAHTDLGKRVACSQLTPSP